MMKKPLKIKYKNFTGKSKTVSIEKWKIQMMIPLYKYHEITYCLADDIKIMCINNGWDHIECLDWLYTNSYQPIIDNKYDVFFSYHISKWVYNKLMGGI